MFIKRRHATKRVTAILFAATIVAVLPLRY